MGFMNEVYNFLYVFPDAMDSLCDKRQFARLGVGIKLNSRLVQNVLLDQCQEWAQCVNTARSIALGGRAGLVAHDLCDGTSRSPGGLTQQGERTAQPGIKPQATLAGTERTGGFQLCALPAHYQRNSGLD